MKSNVFFESVMQIVCEECEVSVIEVLGSLCRDAVDARCLLVCELSSIGISDENIGAYLSMTRQGVNKLKNAFRNRCKSSFYLQIKSQRVRNRIATEIRGEQSIKK